MNQALTIAAPRLSQIKPESDSLGGLSEHFNGLIRDWKRASEDAAPAHQRMYLSAPGKNQQAVVRPAARQFVPKRQGTELALFNSAAAFKIATSKIAMHLPTEWRNKLFSQVDSLLDIDEWVPEDLPPAESSSLTFLRLLLHVRPRRRPGLAASGNGDLVATWIAGDSRLIIRCMPDDHIRWSITRVIDGEKIRAAGDDKLLRTLDVLAAYDPQVWFD